jgi:hypothetical protein
MPDVTSLEVMLSLSGNVLDALTLPRRSTCRDSYGSAGHTLMTTYFIRLSIHGQQFPLRAVGIRHFDRVRTTPTQGFGFLHGKDRKMIRVLFSTGVGMDRRCFVHHASQSAACLDWVDSFYARPGERYLIPFFLNNSNEVIIRRKYLFERKAWATRCVFSRRCLCGRTRNLR